MKILLRANLEICRELDEVALTLDQTFYLDPEKAKLLNDKLEIILIKIDNKLKNSDLFSENFLNEQKTKTIRLFGRCENLKVDSQVVQIAERAKELLLKTSEDAEHEINYLKKEIERITTNHILSIENRKLIRFAELIINSFELKEENPLQLFADLNLPIDQEHSLLLLETAQFLYFHDLKEAQSSFSSLPDQLKDDLKKTFATYEIALEMIFDENCSKESAKKAAQIIVGFCDILTCFKNEMQIPTHKELQDLFCPS